MFKTRKVRETAKTSINQPVTTPFFFGHDLDGMVPFAPEML